jgi:hypothetical protein
MPEELKQLIAAKPCSRKEALIEEIMIAFSFHVSQWPEIRLRPWKPEFVVRPPCASRGGYGRRRQNQIGPR